MKNSKHILFYPYKTTNLKLLSDFLGLSSLPKMCFISKKHRNLFLKKIADIYIPLTVLRGNINVYFKKKGNYSFFSMHVPTLNNCK